MKHLTAIALALALQGGVANATTDCADVALVLAIDASSSIDEAEFALQQQGYRKALQDPRMSHVLQAAGTVDIAVVLWGDSAYPPQVLPWTRISEPADVHPFAERLATMPRQVGGNTDIWVGLAAAFKLFEQEGHCAWRRVIDLSGDGRATPVSRRANHLSLSGMRDKAKDLGVTINALAILSDYPDLAAYYERSVLSGTSAFVIEASGFEDFHRALTDKLARELLSQAEGPRTCGRALRLGCPG